MGKFLGVQTPILRLLELLGVHSWVSAIVVDFILEIISVCLYMEICFGILASHLGKSPYVKKKKKM